MSKPLILAALRAFIRQRPGLEFGNYGDWKAYRAEMRSITRDLAHAQQLLDAVEWRDSITADMILDAAKHSFSGRLSIVPHGGGFKIDYCTGQYWPTEYRLAVCDVLSSALWAWLRDECGYKTGDAIRKAARLELDRPIASRFFN